MPLYKYIAINSKGEAIEGSYAAGDKTAIFAMIREKQYHPITIQEMFERKEIDVPALTLGVGMKELAVFCRQFSTMLNAGVTIIRCLDIIQMQTEHKKLKKALKDVYGKVQQGDSFSYALKQSGSVFPDLMIHMVEAGEASGSLDTIMERLAVHFEKETELRNKVKAALTYPIILSIVATAVVISLLTFVMPTFVGLFASSGVELPTPTKILILISGIIKSYWYILLAFIAGAVYLLRTYSKTDKGGLVLDKVKLSIPVIKGTVTKLTTSRFTRTLSTLLSSGMPLLQAMEVVSKVVGNRAAAEGILKAREEMRKGTDLSGPIKRTGIFPPMVDSMIHIGEESGKLDELLDKTADFFDKEVESALKKMVTMLEPLLIVVMAGVIGFIVISIAFPMFDMLHAVRGKK